MEEENQEIRDGISGQALVEKNKKIKKEINKIKRVFQGIPKNKKEIVEKLIENAAFMSITLDELKEDIKKYGVKETYVNGKDQYGFKESIESKTYNTMIKNYSNVIKQLIDFLPKEEQKNAGEDLLNFIASGNR